MKEYMESVDRQGILYEPQIVASVVTVGCTLLSECLFCIFWYQFLITRKIRTREQKKNCVTLILPIMRVMWACPMVLHISIWNLIRGKTAKNLSSTVSCICILINWWRDWYIPYIPSCVRMVTNIILV